VSLPSWRTDRRKTSERGYGWDWQKRRAGHLAANPLCVICQSAGLIVQATVCDHITPHKGDPELFKGPLQSLCKRHHDSDKQVIEKTGWAPVTIGPDGYPILCIAT